MILAKVERHCVELSSNRGCRRRSSIDLEKATVRLYTANAWKCILTEEFRPSLFNRSP